MTYDQAMSLALNGGIVKRQDWRIDIRYIEYRYCIFQFNEFWKRYEPTPGDLFAEDWELVK